MATAAVSFLVLEPLYLVLTTRAVDVPVLDRIRSVSDVFLAGLAMAAVVAAVRVGLVDAGLTPGPRLAALVALGQASTCRCCGGGCPS